MGGPEFSQKYSEKLQEDIKELFENYQKHNEGKNIFSSARTPAVLFTVMAIAYILSGVFALVGLDSFANLCNLLLGVFLILLSAWIYVRYSGEQRTIGQHIDFVADTIWEKVCILNIDIFYFTGCRKSCLCFILIYKSELLLL